MNERLLVLGGTGFIGRALIARLTTQYGAAGARFTVPSRRPAAAKALAMHPTVQLVRADVHDEATLRRLVQGQDAVVNLVAVLQGDAARFEAVHVQLPRRLAAACAAAGVRRLVHVSALGAAADAPSMYLRSKAAGEAVLQEEARRGSLDLTVLRPSIVFGAEDRFLNLFAGLQALAPLMPLAGAEARLQPVWVEDMAAALQRCLFDAATIGHTYECAGPREYALAELVRLAGLWSGHPRPVFGIPMALGRLQAALLGLLPGEPLLSADNLASLQVPNVATPGAPGLRELGITPMPLEQVMPALLARAPTRLDAFRRLARRG